MANPSMFGKRGQGGNGMLIPTLISMGLEFFTSRRAAKNIEAMALDLMGEGLIREAKYTGTMEGNLQRQRDRYESLFKVMFEGMPKDPTMEKIFGPEKDYGFTLDPTVESDMRNLEIGKGGGYVVKKKEKKPKYG